MCVLQDHRPLVEKKKIVLICDCHLKNSAPILHLNFCVVVMKGSLKENHTYLKPFKKTVTLQSNLKLAFPFIFFPFLLFSILLVIAFMANNVTSMEGASLTCKRITEEV